MKTQFDQSVDVQFRLVLADSALLMALRGGQLPALVSLTGSFSELLKSETAHGESIEGPFPVQIDPAVLFSEHAEGSPNNDVVPARLENFCQRLW